MELLVHDARIADMIVQGAFLRVVKRDHEITDVTDHAAQHFGKSASRRASVAETSSVGRDHLQPAQHFAGSCAVFSEKEYLISDVHAEKAEFQEQNQHGAERTGVGLPRA